jgi:glycerol uptake facilitator protein
MDEYFAEFLGTAILVLLGNGAVANVVLRNTKGENSGWIVITAGWGMAVFIAVFTIGPISGAHINPARDLGPRLMHALLPIKGKRDSDWAYSWVPVIGPVCGAVISALLYFFIKWIS